MTREGLVPESSGAGYTSWIGNQQGNRSDAERISNQNTSLGRARWGVGQREFIHKLQERYQPEGDKFQPKTWFEVGVGPGAELAINALEEFGDGLEERGLVLVEIDAERLYAAKATLQEYFKDRPDLLKKIDFDVAAGDAAAVLKSHAKKADVIHAQLLFQHLLPHERKNILQACVENIHENGLLIVADVAFDDWTARPSRRGIEGVVQLRDVHRERKFIRTFRRNVYRRHGKKDFANAADIEDMIQQESQHAGESVFEVLPELGEVIRVQDVRLPEDRDEIAYLSNIVGLASRGRRQLEKRADWFNERLVDPERPEDIDYPSLARVVARRIPSRRVD